MLRQRAAIVVDYIVDPVAGMGSCVVVVLVEAGRRDLVESGCCHLDQVWLESLESLPDREWELRSLMTFWRKTSIETS